MNAVLKPAQKGVAWHLAILALALLAPLQLLGQSCTTATCNAASASLTDVLAALPSTSNANATVTVNIPAGSATWSSPLNYTIPAGVANPTAVTTLIIQGATTINCTGTAGQSSWSCPATDSTIITDGVTNANTPTINITTGGSTTFFRITGLTLKTASGTAKNDGMMKIGGASQNVRIDHNHIDENGQNNSMIETVGSIAGVADHNLFSLGNNSNVGNGFRNFSSSDGVGDAAWNSATSWGTTGNWWYLESDYFTGGSPTDCYNGGKLVVRYSTINNAFVMALHGTKNDAGRGRSCRATELYQNYMSGSPNANAVIGQNGGTSMLWGNNVASGYNHFNAPGAPRNFVGGDSGTSPWGGMCGTTVRSALGQSSTDPLDGNSSSSTGYPCLDGVGRGQGLIPNLGSPTWPSQKLEPEYMFMNTLAAADLGYINDVSSLPNRDVYADCNGKTFAGVTCSSFNGTQGTGFGLHSARPSTCTAGPGGTFAGSPTGSYGVGYWETDTNTFFVCSAANTWTAIYSPLIYPHPLASGTTSFSLGITATNGSVSGTNCAAGTYASGTTIGPCSATPNSGYSFTPGWSSTGSASCSGTGTCGPFTLTANSTLTAAFTLNSWTLTTATAGTGSGTITGCSGSHNYGSTFTCTVTATSGTITSVSGCGGSGTTTFTGTMPNNACTVTATFSNTLATPIFTPPAGTYGSAQSVSISSIAATKIVSMTEGSNGNASNGDAPSRNAYTNCATGWNGSALTPVGQPVGNLYCTATDRTNAMAAGGPDQGVVTSAISGTGTHALDNGNGAGGDDSLASITATYGQANQNGCPVGTNIATPYPGLTLLGNVASSNTVYGATTQASAFNSSSLEPTKWVVSTGDNGLYWVRETCQKVNATNVAGEHLEYDANYNTTAGVYIGEGWDFDFPHSKFRYAGQGQPWTNVKLVADDGTTLTTYNWQANHWIYTQIWMHHDAACNTGPASGCTYYYDRLCIADYTAGTGQTCYAIQDATTGLTPSATAVSKTSWTRNEFALQHQWDVNQASATLTNTVDFDNLVAFSLAPNVFYTTNGSTPTTGSTPYFSPIPVPSSLTIKALAQQSGFTNSAVGSAAYVISPMNSLVTTATNGSVSGTNCATGSYTPGTSIGACTATPNSGFSFQGWSGSGACSTVSGTGTASCTLSTNATLTATFAPIVTCADPTQLSPNFSGTYTVPPTTLPITVGFTSPTAGCTMHYTSDGSAPTCSSTAYPGGDFSITTTGAYTYRVIACQSGYTPSNVIGGLWTVQAASSTTSVMGGKVTLSGTQGVQ